MKLELKHLSPYLPYEIRCKMNGNGNIETLNGLSVSWAYFSFLNDNYEFYEFKPILRPLSDLTTFATEIFELFDTGGNGVKWAVIEDIELLGNCFYNKDKIVPMLDIRSNEGYSYHFELNYLMPSWLKDFCLEKHIDLFSLIPARVAIDINTLTNNHYYL